LLNERISLEMKPKILLGIKLLYIPYD